MKKSQLHRDTLVRTAMRLFRRQGYASTGLQQILAESGAPKGSLYYYFPGGKEALGEAAVVMAGGMIAEMLSGLAKKHKAPKRFLRGYCKVMADWMEESDYRSGCPVATTLLETVPESTSIAAACGEAIDSWVSIIAGVYKADGMKARHAREKAESIVAAMEGALILSRVRQSSTPIMDLAKWL
jgi:TetR/AcrR family transcriptional repressor of lmrAB and yxaGH operons